MRTIENLEIVICMQHITEVNMRKYSSYDGVEVEGGER